MLASGLDLCSMVHYRNFVLQVGARNVFKVHEQSTVLVEEDWYERGQGCLPTRYDEGVAEMAADDMGRKALQHLINRLRMMNKQEQLAQLRIFFASIEETDIVDGLYTFLAKYCCLTEKVLMAICKANCIKDRDPEL